MFRTTFRNGSTLLALVTCLSLAHSAQARTVPHKEKSNGQLTSLIGNRMDWVAAGLGTHYGNFTEVGYHYFLSESTLAGVFTVTAADGSTLAGIYEGTFGDLGGGFTGFEVSVEWLVGTGRLEGVTGTSTASASMENATGKIVITASGLWDRP